MKRLAVFMDGTWNVPENETNVSRLLERVAPVDQNGILQRTRYVDGVGTTRTSRLRGAFGKGINRRIRQAYQWLAENYEPGDEIFVFGFSRGAFEARSLVGFLDRCGLSRDASDVTVATLFERYRRPDLKASRSQLAGQARDTLPSDDLRFLDQTGAVEVQFLGVWDTVRYLDMPYGNIRGLSRSENLFHDIMATSICRHIRQARAIDEHREPYRNEHFDEPAVETEADIEQRWFIGDHCDVGGGHPKGVISNVPLRWMQMEAASAGLHFSSTIDLLGNEHLQPLHDTYYGFLKGVFRLARRRYYREIRNPESAGHSRHRHTIDATVFDRWRQDSSYRPPNLECWSVSARCDPATQLGDHVMDRTLQRLHRDDAKANAAPELIFLVHGTGVTDESRLPIQWWKPGSLFATTLSQRLGEDFSIVGSNDHLRTLTWFPGPNSEAARRAAGDALFDLLEDLELRKRRYHLVGHSHGGSVIWHCLRKAASRDNSLKGLQTWTTVGTPFLEFRSSMAGPWQVAAFLLAVLTVVVLGKGSGIAFADLQAVRYGLGELELFLTILLFGLTFLLLFALFAAAVYWAVALVARGKQRAFDVQAATFFGSRWLAIWHSDDEPIAGLSASMASPPDLTPKVAGSLSSPLRKLFAAPYDRFLARAGDEFAWRLIMRRLQGADLRGIDMMGAGAAPAVLKPGWPPLAPSIEDQIRDAVLKGMPTALKHCRARLEAIRATGDGRKLLDVLPADLWSSVVHTSYFDNDSVIDLIGTHIAKGLSRPSRVAERLSPPPFTARTWFAARTAVAIAVVALFTTVTISFAIPWAATYQLEEIANRVKRFESLAVQSSVQVGRLLVRLDAVGRLGEPADVLSKIVDPTSASLASQQLAYAYGFAGRDSEVQKLANLSENLASGTGMDWRLGQAAVLLQALTGATRAKRKTDDLLKQAVEVLREVLSSADGSRLLGNAVYSLSAIGQDQFAIEMLTLYPESQSWCENEAARVLDSGFGGNKVEGKRVLELCKVAVPKADLDPYLAKANAPSDQRPKDVIPAAGPSASPIPEFMNLIRTKQANVAGDRVRALIAATGRIEGARQKEVVELAKALREAKEDAAVYSVVRNLFDAQAMADNRLRRVESLTQTLATNHLDYWARRIATEISDSSPPYLTPVTQHRVRAFGTSAAIFHALRDLRLARKNLDKALSELRESSGEPNFYHEAVALAELATKIDYATAHTFLDIGLTIVGKNPLGEKRSQMYGNLALHFAKLGDYRAARESAERAGSLSVEGNPSALPYSGLLGGYQAILDVEIARRFPSEGKALGVTTEAAGPPLTYTFQGSQANLED